MTRGLWYASQSGSYARPWNSIYQSILGGATFYSENYVKNNKYTLYFKKFNVLNGQENVGKGQYMTNVQGAESEAAALRKGYLTVMDSAMTFIIPVYENMPASACLKPTSNANNDNYLSSLSVGGYELNPAFSGTETSYTVEIPAGIKSIKLDATARNAAASVSGTGYITISTGEQYADITVTAANGETRVYSVKIVSVSEDPTGSIRAEVEAMTLKLSSSLSEDNVITISWTASSDCPMSYYQVFRSVKKSSGYGTKAYYTTENGEVTSFADSGNFEAGTTYYYKVRGVRLIDGKKVYTNYSSKAWRTIKELKVPETPAEPEAPETSVTPSVPEAPGTSVLVSSVARGVMATTVDAAATLTDSGKIRLDWKKSPGYKVDYYEVYRSESKDSGYGETPYFKNSSGDVLYYVNTKNLKEGKTYYYKVRGVRTVDGQPYYTCWSNVTWQTIGGVSDDPDEPSGADPYASTRIGVEATTVEMSSSLTEKGTIRLDWSKSPGYKVDYYEIWRSTERYSGYGNSPYYTTSSGSKTYYVNTKGLASGVTYYYRVRGVRVINGEKIYTQWSNRSWRTIK